MTKKHLFSLPFPVWLLPVCLAAVVLAYFAQFVWFPDGWPTGITVPTGASVPEIEPVSDVLIAEVMTGNRGAFADENGQYPDYVELYNRGAGTVDLAGWTLTDNPNRQKQFTFPQMALASGASVVVFCDGTLQNEAGKPYHAPFGLSRNGDAVLLYSDSGAIMEATHVPAMGNNQVYARKDSVGAFAVTDQYTPGMKNTEANYGSVKTGEPSDSGVVIRRVVAENKSFMKDDDGDYSDVIEIYNGGSSDVNLLGFALSDQPDNPQRWRFPDVTLRAGKALVVFASGKSRAGAALHANFKLNAEGEIITLLDAQGRLCSRVDYGLMKADQVYEAAG